MKRTQLYYCRRASEILSRICYATLATVTEGGAPWNSPVSVVYAPDLSMYWFSDKQAQHSRNVRATGRVFIVVYDSTWPEGSGGQGVFIEAAACEITDPDEIRRARRLKNGHDNPRAFTGNSARRVYKATPERIWINDVQRRAGRFVRDCRTELPPASVAKFKRAV